MLPDDWGPLAGHESFLRENPAPDWLQDLRRHGAERFAKAGLPTPKMERWKYTNILPLVGNYGATLSAADVTYVDPDNLIRKLSDVYAGETPQWLIALQTEDPVSEKPLWDLCNAYIRDGLMIDVKPGERHDNPIHITIDGHDGAFFVPRTAFRLGEGSELTIIEHHTGEGRYWNNRLTQIMVGPGAKLRHIRIQENAIDSVYTQNTHVRVADGGTYEALNFVTGAALSRFQLQVDLNAPGAQAKFAAVHLVQGAQLADQTVTINHNAPNGRSQQFVRSVIDDRARSVFQGKVHVAKGADGTDAQQLSNAILMAEAAEMDTKPELEIYADDVKCSHGATTGQLDEEALFYARSRGIPQAQARSMLVEAFVGEVLEDLSPECLRSELLEKVDKWLNRKI